MKQALSEQVTAGLSKISMALKSKSWGETFSLNLTPTQAQILSIISNGGNQGIRLNQLAKHLGVTDPTACDAVNTLRKKGLVSKKRSELDQRAVILKLTRDGKALSAQLSEWPDFLIQAINSLSNSEKEHFLLGIVKMIKFLQDQGDIAEARMCVNCKYFDPFKYDDKLHPHHCHFVDAPFGENQLRITCPDYERAKDDIANKAWLDHHNDAVAS